MQSFAAVLLGNTAIACVIALAALLALLLRRAALSHVLWLMVLIKLITPPIVRVPVVPLWDVKESQPVVSIAADDAVEIPPADAGEAFAAQSSTPIGQPSPELTGNLLTWCASHGAALLLAAWAAGTVGYAARLFVLSRQFRRVLQSSSEPDAILLAQVRNIANHIGLANSPDVRVVDAAISPMVICLRRTPSLILPKTLVDGLNPDALRAVLAHELAHLRRKDHWVRWIESAATALMWWHPMLWLARRGLHEAEEQCCDAWVVWALPESRRVYAEALVTTASLLSPNPQSALPPGASGLGQFQHLKRRLVMIMEKRTRHGVSKLGKMCAAVMLLALPVVPAIAVDKPTAEVGAADSKDAEIQRLKTELERAESIRSMTQRYIATRQAVEDQKDAEIAKLRIALAETKDGTAAADNADDKKKEDDAKLDFKAPRPQIDAEIAKARARMRADSKKYTKEELQEAEALYQVANKSWRSPEAKASLEQMVKKFPKFNRTGCAILYLGQYSKDEEREKYLKQAVEDFSDCFYGNGVQVGGYARYLLGHYYLEKGDAEKGTKLLKEISQKYPKSVTHKGDQLAKIAAADLETASKKK